MDSFDSIFVRTKGLGSMWHWILVHPTTSTKHVFMGATDEPKEAINVVCRWHWTRVDTHPEFPPLR